MILMPAKFEAQGLYKITAPISLKNRHHFWESQALDRLLWGSAMILSY